MPSSAAMPALPPGFRFHPTDEELIVYYLTRQAASMPCPVPIIAEVNIYKCNPWDLPGKALFGQNEWFFFSPRDRKYPNGARPNRAAGSGYWKATGTDKAILSSSPASENIGVKKALVFYRGKPPKGVKTDWIMHEYRLTAADTKTTKRRGSSSMRLDDWVLCRIHKKCSSNLPNFSSDQEQESSTVEDSHNNNHSNNTNTVSSPKSEALDGDADDLVELQQFCPMAMTKSCSITDLLNTVDYADLSQLLLDGCGGGSSSSDAAGAMAAFQPPESPLVYGGQPPWQTLNYNSSHLDVPQLDDRDYANGNNKYNHGMKRRRSSSSLFCNQLQLPADQYSGMLVHPFLNQQLQM